MGWSMVVPTNTHLEAHLTSTNAKQESTVHFVVQAGLPNTRTSAPASLLKILQTRCFFLKARHETARVFSSSPAPASSRRGEDVKQKLWEELEALPIAKKTIDI